MIAMVQPISGIFRSWHTSTFSSLNNATFRRIWAAGVVSNLGSVVQIMAASWLMVSLTTSPILIASVQTAAAMPLMLFGMIGGAAADLFDRRRQILVSLATCTSLVLLLYFMVLAGHITAPTLLAVTALISVGSAFFFPAWQASAIDLVSRKNLSSAAALNNLGFNVCRGVGPLIGSEIIAFAGVSGALLFNAVSYGFLFLAVLSWRSKAQPLDLPRQRLRRAIGDGIRYIRMSPNIWRLLFRGALFGLSASVLVALPPLLALELGGGPRTYGVLLTGFGGGAVLGALGAASLRAAYSSHQLVTAVSAVSAAAIMVLSFNINIMMSTIIMALAGAAWVVVISTINVAVQLASPRWVAARTIAAATTAFQFGIASGAILWGLIAAQTDVRTTFLISGAMLSAATLLCYFLPVFDLTDEDLEPSAVAPELTAPKIHPRAGPVVVAVDYVVPPKNAVKFMQAMDKIRRVRLRDGGMQWSLQQDIDYPAQWLERYQSPTWGDYLHRIHRSMQSDSPHFEAVRALCSQPPKWSRRLERPMGAKPLSGGGSLPDEFEPGTLV